MAHSSPLRDLLVATRKLLAFHQSLGIEGYPRTAPLETLLTGKWPTPPPGPKAEETAPSPLADRPVSQPAVSLAQIRQELAECCTCSWHADRQRLVFGRGPEDAGLIVVGEWPTAEDEGAGAPFQGEAGTLLDRMLQAIGLARNEVYLTLLLKCRPAKTPTLQQVRPCLSHLSRELEALSPRVICAMGPLAAQAMLGASQPIFQLRGRFQSFNSIPLMPTFHPDFLLRNPEMKKATWQDLQAIQTKLARPAND